MTIADTVLERLAGFNVPLRRDRRRPIEVRYLDSAAAVLRGLGLVCVGLIVGLSALAGLLARVAFWLGPRARWLLGESGFFAWFWLLPAFGWLVARTASF